MYNNKPSYKKTINTTVKENNHLNNKNSYFDPSTLCIVYSSNNSTLNFTLTCTDKELFFHNMKKKSNDDKVSMQDIIREYNSKISELFIENDRLNNIVNNMNNNVIYKMQEKIKILYESCDSEKCQKEIYKKKLDEMDSVYQENNEMKEEIKEKNQAIDELNSQQIKSMNKVERLSIEIQKLKSEIKSLKETILLKEKEIQNKMKSIAELEKINLDKNNIIKEKDIYITVKEGEIKKVISDCNQWEEKFKMKEKENDNYKKWTLWDLNLEQSYKKIDELEEKMKEIKRSYEVVYNENNELKLKNGNILLQLNEAKEKIQKFTKENETLMNFKLKYEQQREQIEDYMKIKNDNENLKKELKSAMDSFDNKIRIDKINYEDQLNNIKKLYESKIKEDKKVYEDDINCKIKLIAENEDKINKFEKKIAKQNQLIENKNIALSNIKENYDKVINKLKSSEEKLIELNEILKSSQIKNSNPFMDNISELSTSNKDNILENSFKSHSSLDKYSFTKEILIHYLYSLYLCEIGITTQTLLISLNGNINSYLSTIFNSTNSSLSIHTELLEDIYFLSFDKLITKKILNLKNGEKSNRTFYLINFEDFDSKLLEEITQELIDKNPIIRIKQQKTIEQIITLFIHQYEKIFDFDIKLSDFINEHVSPVVINKVNKYINELKEDMSTLVGIALQCLKNGKIIINEREVYSFEKYFYEYKNIGSLKNRDFSLEINNQLNHTESVDNIVHNIKFYFPSELTINKCFNEKSQLGINRFFSSIILFQQKLKSLKFIHNDISGIIFSSKIIPMLKQLKELSTLVIIECNLTDEDIKPLSEYLKTCKYLKILSLSNNNITSTGGFFLADAIMKNDTLISLNISKNELNEGGLNSLLNVLTNSNKSLTELNLSENYLQKEDFVNLSDYLNSNPSIYSLDISGNIIDTQSAKLLGVSLKKSQNLKYLKVNNCGLTEESTSLLVNYLEETNISDIELNLNTLGENGALMIMNKIKSSKNIKKISLKQCNMTPIFLDIIASNLVEDISIQIINLELNKYDEQQFKKFCEAMVNNSEVIIQFSKSMLPLNAENIIGNLPNIVVL